MSMPTMTLTVLLPDRIFARYEGLVNLNVDTPSGSLGILPRRRDFITPLATGLLSYQQQSGAPAYLALEQGIMIKRGTDVSISTRRAVSGDDIAELEATIRTQDQEQAQWEELLTRMLIKMEGRLIRRLADFHHV